MSKNKNQEIVAMTSDELENEMVESRNSLDNMKFDHAVKGLDNPNILKSIRRDIARMQTEKTRRKLMEKNNTEV